MGRPNRCEWTGGREKNREPIIDLLNKGASVMSENTAETNTPQTTTKRTTGRRLKAGGWGLFFVWVGVSLLVDLSWAVGLIGVAAIILLGQVARRSFGLRLEHFWVVVGVLFLLGGIWEVNRIDIDLLPILMILAGGALLLSLFRRGSRTDWHSWCCGSPSRGAEQWRCWNWTADD